MPTTRLLPCAGAAAALALLAGCATVTPDGGFGDVAATTQARIGTTPQLTRDGAGQGALAASLRDLPVFREGLPLDMDTAVRIALVNHPGLQATYWNVGIAQADLAQAARPAIPRSTSRGSPAAASSRSSAASRSTSSVS